MFDNHPLAVSIRVVFCFLDRRDRPGLPGLEAKHPKIAAPSQFEGFFLGIRTDHENADGALWRCELQRRLKILTIGFHHQWSALRIDKMGKGKCHPEIGRIGRRLIAGAKQPHLGIGLARRHCCDLPERVIFGHLVADPGLNISDLCREMLYPERPRSMGQRIGRQTVRAGRTSDAKINPPRIERLEHPKALRDLERRVMAEHHPARPYPKVFRARCDLADHNLRRRPRETAGRMMFRQPIAMITSGITELGKSQGLAQGVSRCATGTDRRLIKNTENCHTAQLANSGGRTPECWSEFFR